MIGQTKFSYFFIMLVGAMIFVIGSLIGVPELKYLAENKNIYFLDKFKQNPHLILGHYRKEFKYEKSPKKIRILTIGGSTTYGQGLDHKHTWPFILERMLNKKNKNFEVINLGLRGGNLKEQLLNSRGLIPQRLLRESFLFNPKLHPIESGLPGWLDLNPDLVIMAPQINDVAPDLYFGLGRKNKALSYQIVSFMDQNIIFNKLALSFYLKKILIDDFSNNIKDEDFVKIKEDILNSQNRMKENLSSLIRLWKIKSKVVVVQFPQLFSPKDGAKEILLAQRFIGGSGNLKRMALQKEILSLSAKIDQNVMMETSQKEGVWYNCLFCEIKNRSFYHRSRYFIDPIQLNEVGHQIIAMRTFAYLNRNVLPFILGSEKTIK